METKKLERIVILILLLLNLFLLAAVLADWREERASRRETEASLTALLRAGGVDVAPEVELLQDCPAQCTVVRDLALEQRRVQNLLGRCSAQDLGGSIWYYASEEGQMRIRGTGEMDLLLSRQTAPRASGGTRETESLLSRAGLEVLSFGGAEEEGGESLRLYCCWKGVPVYNAVLTADLSGGRLYMVSGTAVFNLETGRDSEAGMDSVSVLIRFLERAEDGTLPCTRIEGLSPGYLQNLSLSGESTLVPVWRVQTDAGDYFINAVTGEPESL